MSPNDFIFTKMTRSPDLKKDQFCSEEGHGELVLTKQQIYDANESQILTRIHG
ncbi:MULTISPECIES: hypothetical protein [Nostocales]|uniref:Uncharacterized protein n=3 Tax=Nostocales TaxID=1161 RepID=A0A8S9SV73_9CYAN|nr:hypothetical protein [Tolypothrix bouteillei]KAF3883848.1 hypothetical protein DA73_0400039765 [Tolypothrix bouteillei VB521301]